MGAYFKMQVAVFDSNPNTNKDDCNSFLNDKWEKIVSVTPVYAGLTDGIIYIVVYYAN